MNNSEVPDPVAEPAPSPPLGKVKSLGRNASLMAVGTALSRVTGFGRYFALAYAFGFSRLSDTYNLANNVPNIVYELVVGGVLAATLVPVFVREKTKAANEAEAWRAISAVVTVAACVMLGLAVLLVVVAPIIIDLYTVANNTESIDEQRDVATYFLRLFAPQILFYGFISLATGILHAHRRFGPPMFAPILNNVVVICVILAVPHLASDLSLEAMAGNRAALTFLALGTTVGVLSMALVLIPYLRKVSAGRLGWNFDRRHQAVRSIVLMSGWTVGFVLTNQIALWVTYTLANGEPGGVSAFLAAYSFFILPHGIVAVSVMSALQPELAEAWANTHIDAFRRRFVTGLRLIAFVMIPAGAGYALLAEPIVQIVLEYGRFSAESSATTASILMWLALGIPGFSAFLFLARAFQSMTDARSVFFLYLIENAINVATAIPLWFLMGVEGLAASHTIAYVLGAVIAGLALRRRTNGLDGRELVSGLARITIAAGLMAAVVAVVTSQLHYSAPLQVATGILTGAATYFACAYALRLPEPTGLVNRIARR